LKFAVDSKSILGQSALTGESLIINDTAASDLFVANPLLPDTKSEIGIPLKSGGKVIGVMDIHSNQTNAFTQN